MVVDERPTWSLWAQQELDCALVTCLGPILDCGAVMSLFCFFFSEVLEPHVASAEPTTSSRLTVRGISSTPCLYTHGVNQAVGLFPLPLSQARNRFYLFIFFRWEWKRILGEAAESPTFDLICMTNVRWRSVRHIHKRGTKFPLK